MNALPYKKYNIFTNLKEDEVKQRLSENVEPIDPYRYGLFGVYSTKPYEGEIFNDRFKINRIPSIAMPFPIIKGTIIQRPGDTEVKILFRFRIFEYIMFYSGVFAGLFFLMELIIKKAYSFENIGFIVLFMSFWIGMPASIFYFEYKYTKNYLITLFLGKE